MGSRVLTSILCKVQSEVPIRYQDLVSEQIHFVQKENLQGRKGHDKNSLIH